MPLNRLASTASRPSWTPQASAAAAGRPTSAIMTMWMADSRTPAVDSILARRCSAQSAAAGITHAGIRPYIR